MLDVTHKIIDTSNALAICNGNVMSMRSKLIGKIVYTWFVVTCYFTDLQNTHIHIYFSLATMQRRTKWMMSI